MDILGILNQLLEHAGAYDDDYQFPKRPHEVEEEDEFEEDEDEYPPPNLSGKFELPPHPQYDGIRCVDSSLSPLQKLIKKDDVDSIRNLLQGKQYKPGKTEYVPDPFETTIVRHEFNDESIRMSDLEIACFYGSSKSFTYLMQLTKSAKHIQNCPQYALYGQNQEIIDFLRSKKLNFKYNARKVLKGIRHSGRKISPELFEWLLKDVKIDITMSDVLRFNDRQLFEIALSYNVPIDDHTVAFAAKCGFRDYLMQIVNAENVDQETTKQHEVIMKQPETMSGGETALFFAAEQKDFELYEHLIKLGASPVHYLETNGLIPLVYAFNDVDFGMKVLEITELDDYLYEHLISESLIYNNIEMLVRLCEYEKFRPSRRLRGMACLARTKEAVDVLLSHSDLFEISPADVAIIETKKKRRKEVLGLFKPTVEHPCSSYFEKERFEIEGPLGKPKSPGEDRKLLLGMMMGNVDLAMPIIKKRGAPIQSDGKSLFNSKMFNFEPLCLVPTLNLNPEMNPEKQFTPILLASYTDNSHHSFNLYNVGLSLYQRGADPTIEFDNINVLGNLYRSLCKHTSHMDVLKLLWLTRQKIYEKIGKAKERKMEEPDENIYKSFDFL